MAVCTAGRLLPAGQAPGFSRPHFGPVVFVKATPGGTVPLKTAEVTSR